MGKSLGMGYIENASGLADDDFVLEGRYEIEVAGARVPAVASLRPFLGPASRKVMV
jgi:4-methylaminobutanoate oxidase (formaldehyde-forming)